jgi:hypothetical protein
MDMKKTLQHTRSIACGALFFNVYVHFPSGKKAGPALNSTEKSATTTLISGIFKKHGHTPAMPLRLA